jgi:hypothetical protein
VGGVDSCLLASCGIFFWLSELMIINGFVFKALVLFLSTFPSPFLPSSPLLLK